jgi:hypothetical protein
MKNFINKSAGFALGFALVAPWVLANAPTSVNGSLGGFSASAQGGQGPGDWGIPQSSGGQSGAGQASNQSAGGQNGAGQGKGPDAGGYGDGQNTQTGNGQNSQSGSGQTGPGQQNSQSGNGQGEHANDGPTKNNSNNPDGDGSGQGEHANDGPTKNNSNNPDGDGSGRGEHYDDGPTKNNSNNPDGGDGSGSAEGEGPTKNNSNNPDGGDGGQHGNSGGRGSSGSSSGGSGSNDGGDFPPLDPSNDGQYDPSENGGDQQIPSGCAEFGSQCAQCVQRNEGIVQFNRRYLHVAWSVTHQTIEMTNQAIALGDSVSGIHSTQALAWQLAGKPQITEAVRSLRKTYDTKYRIYINNMEQALSAMNECEQSNFAVRDLYARFSSLYLEFVKARYQSPD